jgi:hypothetical protein
MSQQSRIRCLTAAGVALASAKCLGVEASQLLYFSKGPVSLRPQFGVTETFDDNVFYSNANKQSDFITVISPGFKLQLGEEGFNFISLSYNLDRLQFIEHPDLNSTQHRVGLKEHIERARFSLDGSDSINTFSGTVGGGISSQGETIDRTSFIDQHRLDYAISDKTSVYIQGYHSTYLYGGSLPLYDQRTVIGTGGFEYKALSRTSFFGEVYYGQTSSFEKGGLPTTPDARFVGGFIGARGKFTEKLSGMAKGGFESREFSDNTGGRQFPVVEMSLTEQFTENMSLSAVYARRAQVSAQFSRASYTSDSIRLSWLQQIGSDGRFHFSVRGAYSRFEYDPNLAFSSATPRVAVSRLDDVINGGLDFIYDFKIWLHGNLSYDYERLRSDLTTRVFPLDYDLNRVTLGLTIGY